MLRNTWHGISEIGTKLKSNFRHTLKNWAEELYCDIYACSVLGPSYLISFLTFCLINYYDNGISQFSESHPSVRIRAHVMWKYLRENNGNYLENSDFIDYGTLFYESMNLIDTACTPYRVGNSKNIYLTNFLRVFKEFVSDLEISAVKVDADRLKSLRILVDRLNSGIPIGSITNNQKSKETLSLLENSKMKKTEWNKCRQMVVERPTSLWEIINAEWIHKLETIHPKGVELFFSNDLKNNFDESYLKYKTNLDRLDD